MGRYSLVSAVFAVLLAAVTCLGQPTFTANDFQCFINKYAEGSVLPNAQQITHYANCDGSTGNPALTANDFQCFMNKWAAKDSYANCDGSTATATPGWTDLTPPAGALVFYVAANGSDSNAGTQAAPFKTLSKGYSMLRNGQPDQVLLRCGDTFDLSGTFTLSKSANSTKTRMIIASYGTGPRPVVRVGNSGVFFGRILTGVGLVDLEIHSNMSVWNGRKQAVCFHESGNILLEGCYIHGGTDNIVIESPNQANRNVGVTIRRCVIADASNRTPGDVRGQGAYLANMDNWLVEENFSINNGDPVVHPGTISTGRNWYIQKDGASGDCTPGTFRNNVDIDGFDGACQVRPGGTVTNNLSLMCPLGIFVGDRSDGQPNVVSWNVVLESGDINPDLRRGWGIHVSGNAIINNNVVAYNTGTGWGSVYGIRMYGGTGQSIGNYIYEWTRDPALGGPGDTREARSFEPDAGTWTISNNKVFMARPGIVMKTGEASISGSGNQYWAPSGGLGDFRPQSTFAGWTKTASLPADPALRTLLPGGGITAYSALCRTISKQNWLPQYTAVSINAAIRERCGLPRDPQ